VMESTFAAKGQHMVGVVWTGLFENLTPWL
jgi:hypothetical protein